MNEDWKSVAYERIDVPDYYLPATVAGGRSDEVFDGVTEMKAPIGTRDMLAGAWYGHRRERFWSAWEADDYVRHQL
ncbi:hypothetical protein DNAM5_150 [Haloarcula californiae tailed virus 1]|uniref:Uncharacterized protein n=1 Tax=Haloarcula californiae tailed virus 1 TaxID=1273746 RepID=R4TMN2_9CAUD|nr:hypothetical protein M202_gp071 [Haloarcula californiae tailed virus 1]AGM12007.1 hypothetical protein DNAM5_150 [Haloarcula californiae tailed virus 1]UBF23138.1 hypothetical protein HCTV-16_gp155 [Haloarcula virus HCTV-16]